MHTLRRILGVLVMLAGLLGLLLSLAGLAAVWVAKPTVEVYAGTTIDTLNQSITTSTRVMDTTSEALGATIDSVDALSAMLGTTAATLEETKPLLDHVDNIMSTTLPSTLQSTTDSLYTAQEAARVLEQAIQGLDAFRFLLSSAPIVGSFLGEPEESYTPSKPLADSLGELASGLENLPDTFVQMSTSLDATDQKLVDIQDNLLTMSSSVGRISSSLSEYQDMVAQSKSSMEDLQAVLTGIQTNLATYLTGVAVVLSLFFVWLLAAQVVILSQGWELYQGTADRMEGEAE